jgi:hypothetical protein
VNIRKRGKLGKTKQGKSSGHLHLLRALLRLAGHAGLGHVALEDALLDVLRVVLLALLGVAATEEDALHVLVRLRAEEEHDGGDEDNAPLPGNDFSSCTLIKEGGYEF